MKNLLKAIMVIGFLSAANVQADTMDVSPFMGADYYQPWMKAKTDWDKVFPNSTYPGVSFYVGTRFHDIFALELGYDWSIRKSASWGLAEGSTFFGSKITDKNGVTGTTSITRTGGHLDFITFLPVAEDLELMGSFGFGWLQPKLKMTFSVPPSSSATSAMASVAGKGRGVFRVGFGASYMLTETFGARAKLGWESTTRLRVKGNAAFIAHGYKEGAFKGSTAFSLGLFARF